MLQNTNQLVHALNPAIQSTKGYIRIIEKNIHFVYSFEDFTLKTKHIKKGVAIQNLNSCC